MRLCRFWGTVERTVERATRGSEVVALKRRHDRDEEENNVFRNKREPTRAHISFSLRRVNLHKARVARAAPHLHVTSSP